MSTTQELENKLAVRNILLVLFVSINFCLLFSRSVMESVGNNNGKDCPGVGAPAIACTLYGVSFLMLIGMIVMNKDKLNGVKIGLFAFLAILNFSRYCISTSIIILDLHNDSKQRLTSSTGNPDV